MMFAIWIIISFVILFFLSSSFDFWGFFDSMHHNSASCHTKRLESACCPSPLWPQIPRFVFLNQAFTQSCHEKSPPKRLEQQGQFLYFCCVLVWLQKMNMDNEYVIHVQIFIFRSVKKLWKCFLLLWCVHSKKWACVFVCLSVCRCLSTWLSFLWLGLRI